MSLWQAWRQMVQTRWHSLNVRERWWLRTLLTALALLTLAGLMVTPAWHTLTHSQAERLALSTQHAHMLALQAQAQQLQSRTPLSRDEALSQLQNLGVSLGSLKIQAQADRVTVQLQAVPPQSLTTWLSQARLQAQALVLEAHLTRTANLPNQADIRWDGQLVMQLPKRHNP